MKTLACLSLLLSCGLAQVADKANSGYKTPEGRQAVAKGLIAPDRDNRQKPEELVQAMELQPGMVVADIGTGAGYMLPFLSRAVGPTGRVVTFEPYKRSADLIRLSIQANGYTNVDVVQAAVSDHDGKGSLYLSPDNWTEHSLLDLEHSKPAEDGYTAEVEFVRVDSALERLGHDFRVDIVKMDIEGGEWKAIKGMTKVIEQNPHITIMTEFWPQGFTRAGTTGRQYLEYLAGFGFKFQNMNMDTQKVEPMTIDEIDALIEESKKRQFNDAIMSVWGWYTNLLCTR